MEQLGIKEHDIFSGFPDVSDGVLLPIDWPWQMSKEKSAEAETQKKLMQDMLTQQKQTLNFNFLMSEKNIESIHNRRHFLWMHISLQKHVFMTGETF